MEPYKQKVFDLFKYVPHAGQIQIHESKAQFRFAACGAQFGKTKSAVMEALAALLDGPRIKCHECGKVSRSVLFDKKKCPHCEGTDYSQFPDVRGWAVGPTYELSTKTYSEAHDLLRDTPLWKDITENKQDRVLKFKDGSWLKQKSADKPELLAAEELDLIILDEGPRCKEDTFTYLLTRLITRQGWLFAIGTPQGRNWYYNEFLKGQDPKIKDTKSFRFPTYVNPYISQEQIQTLRQKMSERFFRQEVEADFLEDASAVFQDVYSIVNPYLLPGIQRPGPHVVGLDLGKYIDYTVGIALNCETGEVEDYLRIQGEWIHQVDQIVEFSKRFNAPLIVDATGIGDAVAEMIQKKGVIVYPMTLTRVTKEQIISLLQAAIRDKSIKIPDNPEIRNEIEAYQYVRRGMHFSMEAPEGLHDDVVIALALAVWGMAKYSGEIKFDVR